MIRERVTIEGNSVVGLEIELLGLGVVKISDFVPIDAISG